MRESGVNNNKKKKTKLNSLFSKLDILRIEHGNSNVPKIALALPTVQTGTQKRYFVIQIGREAGPPLAGSAQTVTLQICATRLHIYIMKGCQIR